MKSFKYILVLFLTIAVGSTMCAQKVKLKKNQVLVDGVAIAKYDSPDNYNTVFTDLNDSNKKVIVAYTAYTKPGSQTRRQWVTFKNADETLQSDVKLEDLIFSLNFRKGLAETMLKEFNILTMDGIDMDAFDGFMQVERPNLMDEYSGKNVKTTSKEVVVEEAFEDSNIYNKKGFIITGDNEKKDGIITMIFDDYAYQKSGKTVLKYNPEEEGQVVRLFGKIKEGSDASFYSSKSSSNARFCIEGEETKCFYGLELISSGASNLLSAGFDTSAFHEVIKLRDGVAIVRDWDTQGYAIKIAKKRKGYLLNPNNTQKNIEKLENYLDCDVSEFKDKDFNLEETALMLMEHYLANCSK